MPIVTQAEFARLSNAGRSTVAGWIATGIVGGDALVRRGGKVLVDAEKAARQVQLRRDVGQAMGNGLHVRTKPGRTAPKPAPVAPPASPADAAEEVDPLWQLAIRNAGLAGSEFEAGFVAAITLMVHRIGAVAALTAQGEGAPLMTAYALQDVMTVNAMDLGEVLLRDLPSFAEHPEGEDLPLGLAPGLMARIDWAKVAAELGERADLAAWDEAIAVQRSRRSGDSLS